MHGTIMLKSLINTGSDCGLVPPVASFTKEVNQRLAKRPMDFNGRLANRGLTSLVKEAKDNKQIPALV